MTKRKNTTAKSPAEASLQQRTESAKTVGVDVSAADLSAAAKEGAHQAEAEKAKDRYNFATDGNLASPPDPDRKSFPGYDQSQQIAHLLGLGPDAFADLINDTDEATGLSDTNVYGLLALERNGQNRTEYVKAMIKRLDLKPEDGLPGGGPGYTNDIHPVSDLYS